MLELWSGDDGVPSAPVLQSAALQRVRRSASKGGPRLMVCSRRRR